MARTIKLPLMQAEPDAQRVLIDIAALDKQASNLKHQVKTLPVLAKLKELSETRSQIMEDGVKANTAVSDAKVELKRILSDLTPATERLKRNEKLADTNLAHKQLQSLLQETEHLKARIAELEEQQLNVEVELEERSAQAETCQTRRGEIESKMRELIAERDAQASKLATEFKQNRAQRERAAKNVPADLLKIYERVAERNITGAAIFKAGRCQGCGLEMDVAGQKQLLQAPANQVLRCQECGRILVRE